MRILNRQSAAGQPLNGRCGKIVTEAARAGRFGIDCGADYGVKSISQADLTRIRRLPATQADLDDYR